MTKTRLAAALSLALMVAPISQAAKYRIVELPVADEGRNNFPSAINEDGNITVNVKSPYNVPIDLDLIDFESEQLIEVLTDIESARNGNFNSFDYEILLAFIGSGDGSQFTQQISNTISFLAAENETSYISGFDPWSEQDNKFYNSTTTVVKDINDSGFTVGSGEGSYNKVDYTFKLPPPTTEDEVTVEVEATFVVKEFGTKGFVSHGNTIIDLPAPSLIAGGFSEANGINEGNQVVGYGTTLFLSDTLQTELTNCANEDIVDDENEATVDYLPLRGNVPVESCISKVVSLFTNSVSTYAQLRGLVWQLDDQGNLLDTTVLGLLHEPEEDDTLKYSSQAVAINDNGIAVGNSNIPHTLGTQTFLQNYAVIFHNGAVINITPDPDSDVQRTSSTISSAKDINNNNLVTGTQIKRVNGVNRTKFFVYDMNLSELTLPTDFFLGSNSVPLDINNNGLVVGYGEVDASLTGRRTEGFLYDHTAKQFNALSELISCDSPYKIVQANAINDKDEIAATALYRGPSRDSRGEVILDSTGSEVIVDLVTAVKLVPIVGGEIESCEVIDDINRERQGGSLTWIIGLSLLLVGWRRSKNTF